MVGTGCKLDTEKSISKLRFSEKERGIRSFLTRTDCRDDFPTLLLTYAELSFLLYPVMYKF